MLNSTRERLIAELKKTSVGKSFFGDGTDSRTIAARDNVLYSFVFRSAGMIAALIMVPLTLNFLDVEKYGIWLTLTSVIAWFNFFDVGLANGLRNKLAEALAKRNDELARGYVSTTYALLAGIAVVMALIFALLNGYADWAGILNVSDLMTADLRELVMAVFFLFCFRFVLGIISVVLNADQKIGHSSFLDFLISMISLAAVFFVSRKVPGSLLWLGILLGAVPPVVLLISSFWYFSTRYRNIRPSFRYIRLSLTRDLFRLSLQFFVLQTIVLLIFFSNNIIIAQLMGPSHVTEFNVVFKYFSVINTLSVLIMNPFWSAATDAYVTRDFAWLRTASARLVKVWRVIALGAILMALMSPLAYRFWIGDKVSVFWSTTILMCVFVILLAWHNSFVYLINGIGKIRLQLYIYIVMGALIIPLSVFFIRTLGLGIDGSILAMIVCLVPACVLMPVQLRKIMNGSATGLFNE